MDIMDKIGQVANKVGSVAEDTFDYGKAKSKILFEKGKVKDAKEELGEYIYSAMKSGAVQDNDKVAALCAKIDEHVTAIAELEAAAKQSGEDIAGAFKKEEK